MKSSVRYDDAVWRLNFNNKSHFWHKVPPQVVNDTVQMRALQYLFSLYSYSCFNHEGLIRKKVTPQSGFEL